MPGHTQRFLVFPAGLALLILAGCSSGSGASTSAPTASTAAGAAGSSSVAASAPAVATPTSAAPTSTTPSAVVATAAASTPAAGTSAASGGVLKVSGAMALTLTETTNPDGRQCHLDATGAATDLIDFGPAGDSYVLQMAIPAGSTTFPSANGIVAFYDGNDSAKEWVVSTTSQGGSGPVTRSVDNKSGTVDLMMTDGAPPGSPKLAPIHLSGSWTC
jgi:hypothetical protein